MRNQRNERGDPHVNDWRRWAIPLVLCLILCVAFVLPVLGRAICGDPTVKRTDSARSISIAAPSPEIDWAEHFYLPDRHLRVRHASYRPMIVQEDVDEAPGSPSDRQVREPAAEDSRYMRAGPAEVGLTNAAIKGGGLLIVSLFWLVFLVILRRIFDKWFDEDVYTQAWPSTAVICTLLFTTAWILVSVIS